MTAEDLIWAAADATFFTIFVVVLLRDVRVPREPLTDALLFFGAIAFLIVSGTVVSQLGIEAADSLVVARALVGSFLPYLLLRLVEDFAPVPRVVGVGAILAFLAAAISLLVLPRPYSGAHLAGLVGYFLLVQGYCTLRFTQAVQLHTGATQARMRAAAAGSWFLALTVSLTALAILAPRARVEWEGLAAACAFASALGYFFAFAPTRSVRQYWEAPMLRSFLSEMVRLPAQSAVTDITRVVEVATSNALGAPNALLLLWDEGQQRLVSPDPLTSATWEPLEAETAITTRAYRARLPRATANAQRDDPTNAKLYAREGARAILAAPIMVGAGEVCYGVLAVYSDRVPVFTEDDLPLVALLAGELGGFLQRRDFVMRASAIEAREASTRLKDEFLSTAAHDLRTPLTIVVAQGQLLRRHLRSRPDAVDENVAEADRIVREAERMWRMTNNLLDASRLDAGGFVGEREPTDLVALAHEVVATVDSPRHELRVHGDAVVAPVDAERMRQVLQNLVDNAVKFSPAGGEVIVGLSCVGDDVEIRVSDEGIGIPPAELTHIFERFHRGEDTERRGFAGAGVGLFLCKRIVEEHGGRIWAESRHGRGSEFLIRLPQHVPQANAEAD